MKKLFVLLFIFLTAGVYGQQKYALVIGNGNYTSIRKLVNPVNDATAIAAKLRSLGYQVELQTNIGNAAMGRSVNTFIQRLSGSRDNEGFFWFAGHGVQLDGENFLLPVDVDGTDDVSVKYSSYPVNRLIESFDKTARNKVNVVVLDACRNNPFTKAGGKRSLSRGLSVVHDIPPDLFIIFSTAANDEADDGEGKNHSPFADAFLRNMDSNEDISIVIRSITRETLQLTNNKQRPYHDGSIISLDYYSLNPRKSGQPAPAVQPAPSPSPAPVAQPIPEGLEYEVVNGKSVTIKKYTGNATTLNIPVQIQGLPVTAIGVFAFDNSRLTSINLPSTLTSIGMYAFFGCRNLTNIIIPSSVSSIGFQAFSYCGLTNITIPSSVKTIDEGAFISLNSLTNIIVDNHNSAYASIDGILFDKKMQTLIAYPAGKSAETYTVPSSVTTIGRAFDDCSNLISINIHPSVTVVNNYAFSGCSRLANIIVDGRNLSYASIDGILFDKSIRTIIRYPQGKTAITYTIPSSVTAIGNSAFFGNKSLTSITIPSSVTAIGNWAFSSCSSLTSITIPSSVTTIGEGAFIGCSSLISVTLSRRTRVGENAFPETARIVYRD